LAVLASCGSSDRQTPNPGAQPPANPDDQVQLLDAGSPDGTTSDGSSPFGQLRVLLHDKPVEGVEHVWIEVEQITANHADSGWQTVSTSAKRMSLWHLGSTISQGAGERDHDTEASEGLLDIRLEK